MLTNKFATTAKAKHPVHWVKGFASCVYIQCNLKNTVIIISEHCNLNRCQYCSPLPQWAKKILLKIIWNLDKNPTAVFQDHSGVFKIQTQEKLQFNL